MTRLARAVLAALALIAAPAAAIAQSFPITLPPGSLYGRLGITPGPGQAIPISQIFNATAPLTGRLFFNQSVTGSFTTNQQINQFSIDDGAAVTAPGNVINGLNVAYVYGGGSAKGSRQALQVGFTLSAPTNATNPNHFYATAQFNAQANTGDNGTNTNTGAIGSIIALNPAVTLNSGAVNLAEASGIQVTMFTKAGSSVSERSGIEISDNSGAGGAQGATFDDAIVIGSTSGSPGFKVGLAFDCTNFGGCPLPTTGNALQVVGAQTMANFIKADQLTVTNSFITGPGSKFVVDNSGNTQIAAAANFSWVGLSKILSPGDGVLVFTDHNGGSPAGFTRLELGCATTSCPAIARNSAGIDFVLGDGTGHAAITAKSLFVLSGGNVGFGTETNPQARFVFSGSATTGITGIAGANSHTVEVYDADGTSTALGLTSYGTSVAPVFQFANARGTAASFAATLSGDQLGVFGAIGAVANNTWAGSGNSTSRIIFAAAENFSSTTLGTKVSFETTPVGSAARATAMTIQASGGVSVGTTTDPGIGFVLASKALQAAVLTVATLPTCNAGSEGARAYVSDQNTAVAYRGAVTGGGTTRQAVLCSNAAWIQD